MYVFCNPLLYLHSITTKASHFYRKSEIDSEKVKIASFFVDRVLWLGWLSFQRNLECIFSPLVSSFAKNSLEFNCLCLPNFGIFRNWGKKERPRRLRYFLPFLRVWVNNFTSLAFLVKTKSTNYCVSFHFRLVRVALFLFFLGVFYMNWREKRNLFSMCWRKGGLNFDDFSV